MFKTRKEMQSLIDASRKSLANAEEQIQERNEIIRNQLEENARLKEKVKVLEINVDFLINNLSAKKRELVTDYQSKN